MSLRQAFLSLIHLFIASAWLALGIVLVCLPKLPQVRLQIADAMSQHPERSSALGVGVLLLAVFLLISFYALGRGRYLRLRAGKHMAKIDSKILRQMLEDRLRQMASQGDAFKGVSVKELQVVSGDPLEISLTLNGPFDKQEQFLDFAEQGLQELLVTRFGYTKPFEIALRSI